jgi:DTW domain-containing protein YfiP
VLVLQHPQELRQAKNSVALLLLSLAHCEVVIGERFSHGALGALLHRPGRDTYLLYPNVPAAPAPRVSPAAHLQPSPCLLPAPGVPHTQTAPTTPPTPHVSSASSVLPGPEESGGARVRLVVIDATWRKSLRMLLGHRALAELPRLSLDTPAPTRYRAIRAARMPHQVSTLEATVQALALLEGPSFDGTPLLNAFGRFVTGLAARRQAEAQISVPVGTPHSL